VTDAAIDYEPLIQAALMDFVEASAFPMVSYVNRRMAISDTAGSPSSVVAHQESSEFGASRHKRDFRLERTDWRWRLELTFKGEVALGQFERRLIESPPRVLRDRSAGRDQQVTLLLTGSVVQSPPEGQPAGGTRVTYRFNAQLTPS